MTAGSTVTDRSRPAGSPEPAGRDRRRRSRVHLAPFLVPAVVICALLCVYPLVQMARMAVSDVGPVNLIGEWPFTGLENLREVFGDKGFWEATKATGIFTAVLLVVDLSIGYVAAQALARRGRLSSIVLSLMVFVWALPPLVSGSVWKFLLAGDGAINSVLGLVGLGPVDWLSDPRVALWSVSGVAAWASLPFAILILRGGLLSIPTEVLEAAEIDGAGPVRRAVSVVIPLLRPTLMVLVILIILYAFRSFDFVYVMTSGGPGTVTTTLPFLAYQEAFKTYSFGIGGSIASIAMVAVAILAIPYVIGIRREEES